MCSPCQVLGDVYTEVLEAAHPLHRGPTDHKRSVGPLLSLPEVHDQLFSFAHVRRQIDKQYIVCIELFVTIAFFTFYSNGQWQTKIYELLLFIFY